MLVATDVAARGIDVNDLTHIINYNLPDEPEVYIHRSGRTGRAGKNGICLSIIHSREKGKIKNIERKIQKPIKPKLVPSGDEVCQKQLFNLIDKMEKVAVDETKIEPFMPDIYKKLEWLSREELIKHFVSLEFNRFLTYYKDAPNLNIIQKERKHGSSANSMPKRRSERSNSRTSSHRSTERSANSRQHSEFSRFFINAGSQEGIDPSNLIGLINQRTKKRDIEIGKIEIMKNFSFFEVDSAFTDRLISQFENAEYDGKKIMVEVAQDKPASSERRKSKERKSYGLKPKKPKTKKKSLGKKSL